jgi:hypothetical protein
LASCQKSIPSGPRDLNQWAKQMVDLAIGSASDSDSTQEKPVKNPAAIELGRLGGIKGGKALAKKLSFKPLK